MAKSIGWARLWAVANAPLLRSGAWYPVVSTSGSRFVVLQVPGGNLRIPRHLIELRNDRPSRFTVVYRAPEAANPVEGTSADLGRRYAVCPSCGSRAKLVGEPIWVLCPGCETRGLVAWWETG
jgi:hypothetical protein